MLDLSDSLDNVERVRTPTPSQTTLPPPAKRPREDFGSLSTIHKRIPQQGEFQSVTLNDGARFYLSLRAKERKEVGSSDGARDH